MSRRYRTSLQTAFHEALYGVPLADERLVRALAEALDVLPTDVHVRVIPPDDGRIVIEVRP